MMLRKELGLTTEQAADRCGLNRATWQTWEHGASPRNMAAVVAAITLATGVDRDWLMWGGPLDSRPSEGPGGTLGQSVIRHNDTELMQYRSLHLAGIVRVKSAA